MKHTDQLYFNKYHEMVRKAVRDLTVLFIHQNIVAETGTFLIAAAHACSSRSFCDFTGITIRDTNINR